VPALTPVTTPLELIEAMPVLLLVHVPPAAMPVRLVLALIHAVSVPVITGWAVTEITVLLAHPAAVTTEIVVVPADIPVTRPEALIVAFAGVELIHEVVAGLLVRLAEPPMQTAEGPPIAGIALMVTTCVLVQPVGNA
jgi:hypothetical protein